MPTNLTDLLLCPQCHSGIMGGGHYVTYAKNPNRKWYCYNDSSCKVSQQMRELLQLFHRLLNLYSIETKKEELRVCCVQSRGLAIRFMCWSNQIRLNKKVYSKIWRSLTIWNRRTPRVVLPNGWYFTKKAEDEVPPHAFAGGESSP